MASEIKINVYRAAGEWFGARWIDGEYDGCDRLDCSVDASDDEAIAHAETMHMTVDGPRTVRRVDDSEGY